MSKPRSTRKTVPNSRRTPDGRPISLKRVEGGTLVFADSDLPGRDLIGFTDVESWSMIRSALAKRGLGVGAIHQLEEYDRHELGL